MTVDVDNGCMHFVPGQHREPLLEHYVAGGEPTEEGRMLAIKEPERVLELAKVVACPLRAGGATVHWVRHAAFHLGQSHVQSRPQSLHLQLRESGAAQTRLIFSRAPLEPWSSSGPRYSDRYVWIARVVGSDL